jgi:hypothetical protein
MRLWKAYFYKKCRSGYYSVKAAVVAMDKDQVLDILRTNEYDSIDYPDEGWKIEEVLMERAEMIMDHEEDKV